MTVEGGGGNGCCKLSFWKLYFKMVRNWASLLRSKSHVTQWSLLFSLNCQAHKNHYSKQMKVWDLKTLKGRKRKRKEVTEEKAMISNNSRKFSQKDYGQQTHSHGYE